LPVGGFGTVEQLVTAYEGAGGGPVDPAALHWWQVLGTLRWGIICIVQVLTHTTGAVRSVELAAIGRRVCEVEWDLLELLPVSEGSSVPKALTGIGEDAARTTGVEGWSPHDIPSAAELLDAVREFLDSDVLPVTEGRVRFHVRVAANVVGIVARELVLGPPQAAAHMARLERLGVHTDAELAATIRSGALDARAQEVREVVRATVANKLAVANPRYLAHDE
jgi:hypothetical protein